MIACGNAPGCARASSLPAWGLFAHLTAPKGHHMIAWGNAPGFGRASSHPFPLVPAPSLPAQRAGREGAATSGVFGSAHGPGAMPQAFLFGPIRGGETVGVRGLERAVQSRNKTTMNRICRQVQPFPSHPRSTIEESGSYTLPVPQSLSGSLVARLCPSDLLTSDASVRVTWPSPLTSAANPTPR